MKTKISLAVLALFFLLACGSSEQPKEITFATEPDKVNNPRYIIKASNTMYISMAPDSTLVANQPFPAEALVFEKIELGKGKWGLRTPGGKYVSDNRNNESKLDIKSNRALVWEEFEIIALDQLTVNIKTSQGKYVCADQGNGNVLYANRDKAAAWETFVLEQK